MWPRWFKPHARQSEDVVKLTVITNDRTREVALSPGASVRELLESEGLHIRSGCRGNGACGLCLVQVEAGNVPGPTKAEYLVLSTEQLARNIRLACQLTPENDLRIRVIPAASKSDWQELSPALLPCTPSHIPPFPGGQSATTAYGLAVDVGTTRISLSLWDLRHGDRLSGRAGLNPQSHYGSDVLSRLIAADESAENAQRIARIALDAIREAFLDI
jgi:ferredoxin